MTSTNISGIHGRSNPYYSVLSGSCRLSPCQRGKPGRLCQRPIYPIAHQYSIGACQLHAFAAALRVSRSVLQYEAVGLQISMLLQKADPVFSLDLWCLWEMRSQGLLAHNRCDAQGALPAPCLEAEALLLLSRVGEEWKA